MKYEGEVKLTFPSFPRKKTPSKSFALFRLTIPVRKDTQSSADPH